MGKIFYIMGKSSSGKDTIYKRLLENPALCLNRIIPYTTRPIREGEHENVEYHFSTVEELEHLKKEQRIIECRSYHTIHGIWHYFTVKDSQITLENKDFLTIGTLQSYQKTRDYFGADWVLPIYIEVEDGERLFRALLRERAQKHPKYEELCRRFLADSQDFSTQNLAQAGIYSFFYNHQLEECIREIERFITQNREAAH